MLDAEQYARYKRFREAYHMSYECNRSLSQLIQKPIGSADLVEVELGISLVNGGIGSDPEDEYWKLFLNPDIGVDI